MLSPPVPSFPAIRISDLLWEATHLTQQQRLLAMRGVNRLTLGMPVCLYQDAMHPVFLVYPLYFTGYYLDSLIPRDPLVFTLTPILGMSFAIRVPLNPL